MMQIKGMILEYGEVPPGSGPLRTQYLATLGRAALDKAQRGISDSIDVLGTALRQRSRVVAVDGQTPSALRMDGPYVIGSDRAGDLRRLIADAGARAAQAERDAVIALNFLEDQTNLVERCHTALHEAAALRRSLIGCPLSADSDGTVWIECPSRLAHSRVGLSAGFTSSTTCSICSDWMEDCDHLPGEKYLVSARSDDSGKCSICRLVECGHEVGIVYEALAIPLLVDAVLHEVSLVSRPRYPQARIVAVGIDPAYLGDMIQAVSEGNAHCDFCVGACHGLAEMQEDPSWLLRTLINPNDEELLT